MHTNLQRSAAIIRVGIILSEPVVIECLRGRSAHLPVLVGFASAELLCRFSFPDILDEDAGRGYQRPFNERHSQDFRQYIKRMASSTIPLTLNLRPGFENRWRIVDVGQGLVRLEISSDAGKVMAQVDCQHRLGHLDGLPIILPFMCFIGLSEREEMQIFSVINSKAKGLSTSLLDYHEAQLAGALAAERPELYLALQLNGVEASPWHRRLNLGGNTTAGLKRVVSLRMMQQAIREFLRVTKILDTKTPVEALSVILDFWNAIAALLPAEWDDSRHHMLTKGVGVYALMRIAADLYSECKDAGRICDRRAMTTALSDFVSTIDWSTSGPLKGFGGQSGVKSAVDFIRDARKRARYKVVNG